MATSSGAPVAKLPAHHRHHRWPPFARPINPIATMVRAAGHGGHPKTREKQSRQGWRPPGRRPAKQRRTVHAPRAAAGADGSGGWAPCPAMETAAAGGPSVPAAHPPTRNAVAPAGGRWMGGGALRTPARERAGGRRPRGGGGSGVRWTAAHGACGAGTGQREGAGVVKTGGATRAGSGQSVRSAAAFRVAMMGSLNACIR